MRTDYKKRALVWSVGLAWPGQKPIIGITPNWVRIVSRYVNVMKVDPGYVSGVNFLYTPDVDYVCHIISSIAWSSPHQYLMLLMIMRMRVDILSMLPLASLAPKSEDGHQTEREP